MTTLTGTAKQIEWAENIKRSFMFMFDCQVRKAVASMPEAQQALLAEGFGLYRAHLEGQTAASFWIDRRNNQIDTVAKLQESFNDKCRSLPVLQEWLAKVKAGR